ncbi:universal stress protein [Noviherbaspirillum cavernae]|uniref:Universal stress protein n=1 Tax=Noviherbaspirillum cavernae TaxID=2320862 RepID=A0A418X0R8_9BURK|nr:universal stress protein [Noviherbaspirillum cavernae]RJG06090.1 universal stress protein [Noviherbaspirillum cavernae]
MFETILVPTDGSPWSDKAADAAIGVAKAIGGRIVVLAVAEPYPIMPAAEGAFLGDWTEYEAESRRIAQEHVHKVTTAAGDVHVPCESVVVASFNTSDEIIDAANRFHCGVIFMGSHGRKGLSKLFLGSQTQKVLAHSTIPVMVFR